MVAQVVDPVSVVDLAVLQLVEGAQAVLGHQQRQVVAIPDRPEGVPEADRVDLPAELGPRQVRVLRARVDALLPRGQLLIAEAHVAGVLGRTRDGVGGVVVERDEVGTVGRQQLQVALGDLRRRADLLQVGPGHRVVEPVDPHVEVQPVADGVEVVRRQDVLGMAGLGVAQRDVRRRADLAVRHQLMAQLVGPGLGQHHVVVGLVDRRLRHPGLDRSDRLAVQHHHVLLVDGQPVLHLVAVLTEDHRGELRERIHRRTVHPAALGVQRRRQIEVVHGGDRSDPLRHDRVDQPVVEGDPLRVDLAVAVGDDPRPGDREAVGLQPQLGEELDVLLEPVVVVGGDGEVGRPLGVRTPDVDHRRSLAALVPRSLHLVGGGGGAPEEALRERLQLAILHESSLLSARSRQRCRRGPPRGLRRAAPRRTARCW